MEANGLSCENTAVEGSPCLVEQEDAKAAVENTPVYSANPGLPEDVDKWHFLKL